MIPAERRRLILSRTRAAGVVSIQSLAKELEVSELTVRRDLKRMADEGLLVRTRGGASMRDSAARELSYLEKSAEAHDEKVAIAVRGRRSHRGRGLDHHRTGHVDTGAGQSDQARA